MKVSILSTIAAFLLPMAAMAAPSEGARGLIKRDCPSVFSLKLTIEDNSTYWLAPLPNEVHRQRSSRSYLPLRLV
ncbi:hypothetical protein FJTKL_04085 [Diaporthe vaccinii]|uniref:Uncharacterized protein n=1 Tax=Diaporthe vaccinii TaxID=105482 RepID=A0ABR4DTQ1_9PEZI